MTLAKQVEKQLRLLPPEKQMEVMDFIIFLQQQAGVTRPAKKGTLKKHPAFGLWKDREIDAIQYQQNLRAEWDRE